MEENHDEAISYLTFHLKEICYAVEASNVVEVLEIPTITPIPLGHSYMLGVFNFHGKVVSLMHVKQKLGLEDTTYALYGEVIVLEHRIEQELTYIGILVDTIKEVIDLVPTQFLSLPSSQISEAEYHFSEGVFHNNDRAIYLMDINEVFKIEEQAHA